MKITEKTIRKQIVEQVDFLFNTYCDYIEKENYSQEENDEIESIFMSYRNVIAGTEWIGEKQEYEKYEVR